MYEYSITFDAYTIEELIKERDLTDRELIKVYHSLLSAISYLKENRIVHKDIKPDNILVSKEGEVLLCDFGLSSILKDG